MPRKSQFTDEQIIRALREVDAGAKPGDVCRRLGVTEKTFYRWRQRFGGMEVSDAKRPAANRGLNVLAAVEAQALVLGVVVGAGVGRRGDDAGGGAVGDEGVELADIEPWTSGRVAWILPGVRGMESERR